MSRSTTLGRDVATVRTRRRVLARSDAVEVVRVDRVSRDVVSERLPQTYHEGMRHASARHDAYFVEIVPEQDREFNLESIEGQPATGVAVGSKYPHPPRKIVRAVTSQ